MFALDQFRLNPDAAIILVDDTFTGNISNNHPLDYYERMQVVTPTNFSYICGILAHFNISAPSAQPFTQMPLFYWNEKTQKLIDFYDRHQTNPIMNLLVKLEERLSQASSNNKQAAILSEVLFSAAPTEEITAATEFLSTLIGVKDIRHIHTAAITKTIRYLLAKDSLLVMDSNTSDFYTKIVNTVQALQGQFIPSKKIREIQTHATNFQIILADQALQVEKCFFFSPLHNIYSFFAKRALNEKTIMAVDRTTPRSLLAYAMQTTLGDPLQFAARSFCIFSKQRVTLEVSLISPSSDITAESEWRLIWFSLLENDIHLQKKEAGILIKRIKSIIAQVNKKCGKAIINPVLDSKKIVAISNMYAQSFKPNEQKNYLAVKDRAQQGLYIATGYSGFSDFRTVGNFDCFSVAHGQGNQTSEKGS